MEEFDDFVIITKEEARNLHTTGVILEILKIKEDREITAVSIMGIPFKIVEDKEEAKQLLKHKLEKLGIKT